MDKLDLPDALEGVEEISEAYAKGTLSLNTAAQKLSELTGYSVDEYRAMLVESNPKDGVIY
jgi:hypothetical protein